MENATVISSYIPVDSGQRMRLGKLVTADHPLFCFAAKTQKSVLSFSPGFLAFPLDDSTVSWKVLIK